MGKIEFVEAGDREWLKTEEVAPAELLEALDEGVRKTATRWHFRGGEDELQLFEVYVPPEARVPPHAHETDEIVWVKEGELHFGRRVLSPGDSVYVPRDTLYGFAAGPDGCTFLNFRARLDDSYIPREEYLARHGIGTDRG